LVGYVSWYVLGGIVGYKSIIMLTYMIYTNSIYGLRENNSV